MDSPVSATAFPSVSEGPAQTAVHKSVCFCPFQEIRNIRAHTRKRAIYGFVR